MTNSETTMRRGIAADSAQQAELRGKVANNCLLTPRNGAHRLSVTPTSSDYCAYCYRSTIRFRRIGVGRRGSHRLF